VSAGTVRRTLAVLVLAMFAACEPREPPAPQQTVPSPPPPPPEPAARQQTSDTTDAGLWAHLQSANYRNWDTWPGREQLYAGTEPHGALLTTHVNEPARAALARGDTVMPPGALIVKENFVPDSTLVAITAMYKVAGYDAAGGDWFWARWDANGTPEVSGRAEVCKACHSANAAQDFLMTAR
jgi:hypothetical protein